MNSSKGSRSTQLQRWIVLIQLALSGLLLGMLVQSPHRLVYDEINSAPTIALFHRYGLTTEYLNSLTHGSGPLYGAAYSILSRFSHDDTYRLRFFNFGLLCTLVGLLFYLLRRERFPFALPLIGMVMAIPTVWACTGVALGDPLGLVLLSAALLPLGDLAFESVEAPWKTALRFVLAGIGIGFASLVRQPYIIASGAVFLAALYCRRHVGYAILTPVTAMLMLVPVIITWRGLNPPLAGRHAGLSLDHAVTSLAYGGLFTLLIAPGYIRIARRQLWAAVLSALAVNIPFGWMIMAPVRNLALDLLPAGWIGIYGVACGTILLAVGIYFGVNVVVRTMECRETPWRVTCQLGLLLMLIWPIIMKVQYSSRYTLMAMPFLLPALKDHYRTDAYTLARTVAGGLLGAAVLATYYNS